MANPFGAFCEDFYVNMRLGSQLNLPHGRETLLHFFERIQRQFPTMTRFRKNDNSEMNLEEDRSSESYRWVSVEQKRISSGHVNPSTVEESFKLHTMLLEHSPHLLGISPVEIDYLDVLFGFDLGFSGNMSRRMKRADKIGAKVAVILGDNELDQKVVTVKNLASGEQSAIGLDRIADALEPYR